VAFLRRSRPRRTRILFATDVHGSDIVFRKFLNAVSVYEADVAILGGDLTGKKLAPIVEDAGGWDTSIAGAARRIADEAELAQVVDAVRNLGHYPIVVTREEYRRLEEQPGAVDARFELECRSQVEDWMRRAAERMDACGVPIFVTGGNDDFLSVEPIIEGAPYVTNAEGRVVEVPPGVEMISTGYSNLTPWQCPRDITEDELAERIEAMAAELHDAAHSIFNFHVPPFRSGIDQCAKLDTSVSPPRPVMGEEIAAGSTAVRAAIERHGPVLSLHGHIHESRGVQRIGRTTCVNPGSEYGEGVLRSAVVELLDGGDEVSVQLLAA
jgi:Icc-related predicted phosphoesterase